MTPATSPGATQNATPGAIRNATNVFVLSTGRCGSTTFTRAAEHMTNFTSGHETRCYKTGADRFAYPPRHIESDNRLSWVLGRLDAAYGDAAHYVHLLRDREETALSYARRAHHGILMAYRTEILMNALRRNIKATTLDFARDYVDTVTENIRLFLRDKSRVMTFRIETAETDFPRFWDWIGAEGDAAAGLAEWKIRHNAATRPAQAAGD